MIRKTKSTRSKRRNSGARNGLSASDASKAGFWRRRTVEELAAEQGVTPVGDPADLRGDFWPENESTDEFLAWLRASRREGKGKG